MKAILPILVCLLASVAGRIPLAQAQVPTPPKVGVPAVAAKPARASRSERISGDALLRRVLATVDAQTSIATRLRYQVHLLGRQASGTGTYLQQGRGPGRPFRLELNLKIGQRTARLLHVCDGSTLWISEDLPAAPTLARVDVARLQRAQPKSLDKPPSAHDWLVLGGLSKMLKGLDAAFEFGTASESELDDLRVWTLRGKWEQARLLSLLPNQKQAIQSGQPPDLSRLAPRLPTSVALHIGRDDLFPYRVEFWHKNTAGEDHSASGDKLLVVLEFYEVKAGSPIDRAQFAFQPPPGRKPLDRTGEFLERLGLEDSPAAGAKRASSPRR